VTIRGILTRIAAIIACAALPLVGLVVPADAATLLKICNSSASRGPIEVFSDLHPTGVIVIPDRCNSFSDNGDVRIDPDPELGGDVDSTWWGFIGEGYDYCDPGEGLINPPSVAPNGLRYNTDASGC
jgi:hypothetical protein